MNDRNGYRQIISSRDDELTFGKHKGKSIYWILEHEPGYILWLSDEKIVQFPVDILEDAQNYADEQEDYSDDDFLWEGWADDFDPY